MTEKVKKFIEDNINLIEQNTYHSWQQLYSKFEDFDGEDLPGDFGKCMLDAGINPCEVLGYVPRRFLQFQKDITNFEIPDTCTYIGMSAFEDTSLKYINIPEGIGDIDFLAFSGTRLKSIRLPDSVKILYSAVFHSCQELKEVDLGSIKEMNEETFKDCIYLTKIIVPNTLNVLNANNFDGCTRLREIIYLGTIDDFKVKKIWESRCEKYHCTLHRW